MLAVIHLLDLPMSDPAPQRRVIQDISSSLSIQGGYNRGDTAGRFDPTFLRSCETRRECAARNSTLNTIEGNRSLGFVDAVPSGRPPH